jgi:tRNA(Ile)-lysidine synthase
MRLRHVVQELQIGGTRTAAPVSLREARALFADLADCRCLVLAVSGGPDSTALMYLASRWRSRRGPKLVAVTIDHGLRPESAREAADVGRLARRLGVTHRVLRWRGAKPTSGLQQNARTARYRLLMKAARSAGARHILTAHTLDDQAETVLFRLARGSGIAGLAGMARMSALDDVVLVRPLLEFPKARLVATLRAAKIPFVEDPSNLDPRFARTRLRQYLPTLAAEGLDARRLATLARRASRINKAIEVVTAVAADRLVAARRSRRAPIVIDAAGFAALPDEIALRLLGGAIDQIGDEGPVELAKLEALLAAILSANRGSGRPTRVRRTLAGALVTVSEREIAVERAPPRRKGSRDRVALTTRRHGKPGAPKSR